MEPRTRELLDLLDAEFAVHSRAGVELWDILTALRGPDDGDERLKTWYTAPIRSRAFPKTATRAELDRQWKFSYAMGGKAQFSAEDPREPDEWGDMAYTNPHFTSHVVLAIRWLWS